MRILWLCNLMMPMIARHFGVEASNKEGWLSGLADTLLHRQKESGILLAVAFPAPEEILAGQNMIKRVLTMEEGELIAYGFREDLKNPEIYDSALEGILAEVLADFGPDVVHGFGTEYPHSLAMAKVIPDKKKLLITMQGICSACANVYFADLPESVTASRTLRDVLRKDSLKQQREKFVKRGETEREIVKLAGNIGGRTAMDRHYTGEWNPSRTYFEMKETLRKDFYDTVWKQEDCEPYSIFLSQGDYPLKGLHYMLCALPEILEKYPDAKVYVAGNSLVNFGTLKEKLKISAYGKYLRKLIAENALEGKVVFLGRLTGEEMKAQYLKSNLFVCCSSLENSPNSLGEAMLLGMPCVSADVGGVPSLFKDGVDGILYEGCKSGLNSFDTSGGAGGLKENAHNLAQAVLRMWDHPENLREYCENARLHALKNHDREKNLRATEAVYRAIAGADR